MFSHQDQQRAAREFFRATVKDVEAASTAAIRSGGFRLRREIALQLRQFKKGKSSSGAFRKAVGVKFYPASGTRGPASIVRLKVPFMWVFEEGATLHGNPNLIILLPDGASLGFRRITKGNPWAKVWNRIKGKARLAKVERGIVVIYRERPIYKIQMAPVTVPRKLSFYKTAEAVAEAIPQEIRRLMDGG